MISLPATRRSWRFPLTWRHPSTPKVTIPTDWGISGNYFPISIITFPQTVLAYFVSDFIGDEDRPYFLEEIRAYTTTLGLQTDLFIDNKLTVEDQLTAYPFYVHRHNPRYSIDEIKEKARRFLLEDMNAKFYYLSTLCIKRGTTEPRLRVFERHKRPITLPQPNLNAEKKTVDGKKPFNFFEVFK